MIKVLQVYRTYFPDSQGGLQETIRQIALNTKPQGVVSRIFAPSPDPSSTVIQSTEGEIHQVKLDFEIASCGFSFSGLKKFNELADWADIIHYHFPWPFADFLYFYNQRYGRRHRKKTKPALLTYHSDIVRQELLLKFYSPLMNRFLDSVDHIVCTSENYQKSSENLQKRTYKTSIIPIGLNEDSYPPVDTNVLSTMREKFGENFFLFVGVLRYYKGLHILLQAMVDAPYSVVIVGKGPNRTQLENQAKELGLTNVKFTGYISDEEKVALYSLSCGVVFPSHLRSEAFGVTLLEGAMYGKPLISAEAGSGTSHVNAHGETGLVVKPDDVDDLKQAMLKIYLEPELAKTFGNNARKRFETLFSGSAMGDAYADVYRYLLEQSS